MSTVDIKINNEWKKLLKEQFDAPYFQDLKSFLVDEKSNLLYILPAQKYFRHLIIHLLKN